MLASAALQDFAIMSETDKSMVIDKNLMFRARLRKREDSNTASSQKVASIRAVYFDGKKDKT